jgi:hypothetical protein
MGHIEQIAEKGMIHGVRQRHPQGLKRLRKKVVPTSEAEG